MVFVCMYLRIYIAKLVYACHMAMCVTCRPMVVNERMICHAIIGKNPLKERIMTVDVTAKFIAPLLEFSSRKLLFSLFQVGAW